MPTFHKPITPEAVQSWCQPSIKSQDTCDKLSAYLDATDPNGNIVSTLRTASRSTLYSSVIASTKMLNTPYYPLHVLGVRGMPNFNMIGTRNTDIINSVYTRLTRHANSPTVHIVNCTRDINKNFDSVQSCIDPEGRSFVDIESDFIITKHHRFKIITIENFKENSSYRKESIRNNVAYVYTNYTLSLKEHLKLLSHLPKILPAQYGDYEDFFSMFREHSDVLFSQIDELLKDIILEELAKEKFRNGVREMISASKNRVQASINNVTASIRDTEAQFQRRFNDLYTALYRYQDAQLEYNTTDISVLVDRQVENIMALTNPTNGKSSVNFTDRQIELLLPMVCDSATYDGELLSIAHKTFKNNSSGLFNALLVQVDRRKDAILKCLTHVLPVEHTHKILELTSKTITEAIIDVLFSSKYSLPIYSQYKVSLNTNGVDSELRCYFTGEQPTVVRKNKLIKVLPNPHHNNYSCMGSFRIQATNAIKEKEYRFAADILRIAASNLNLEDTTVMFSLFGYVVESLYNSDATFAIQNNSTKEYMPFSEAFFVEILNELGITVDALPQELDNVLNDFLANYEDEDYEDEDED